jgi:predicted MPP superfamily phosphohydrolase
MVRHPTRLTEGGCTMSCLISMILLGAAGPADADGMGLTFFGWSDQHVLPNGDGRHVLPAIEAMNGLPGVKYPAGIGGAVSKPAFVLGCGDMTDWPSVAAKNTFEDLTTRKLHFPSYNVVGNHDEGGDSPSETVKNWILQRHGALSYTFDRGGVHFIVLFSKYDESLKSPAQPVTRQALEFLRKDLAGLAKGTPAIVAMHLCFDALTNRDEFVGALGKANVVLVLAGHYHTAKVDRFRGVNFVQLPSPAPNGSREVTVIRVTPDRLVAIPYDYAKKAWSDDRRKILDVPIRGSAQSPPAGPGGKTYQWRISRRIASPGTSRS